MPIFSGLLHHSFSSILVVALLMFKPINITYRKWYYTLFEVTCYLIVGIYLMHTYNLSDAFHIAEPLISGTPLTAWVMALMYAIGYALVLFIIELVRKNKNKTL